MSFPPPPPPLPGPAPPPRNSSLVPLLVVGTIGLIALIAGGAVAAMLIVMSRNAPSADAVADAPPAAEAPATEAPAPEVPPDVVPPEAPAPSPDPAVAEPASPAARSERTENDDPAAGDDGPPAPRERPTPTERQATAERARRAAADDDPVESAIRVGGKIPQPTKIRNVLPVYPQIAQSARVQGTVILEATIDRHGRIADVEVLRSIPLLDQAALDAVRQWEYEPTRLNGVAVPVIVTVTVNFSLQ
jgi:protein TonB